ncbi:hypothetical protein SDC9_170210 [bioreactor metagenome]|uniref:Uncharacterized protein n=1 Tax=bioreactor metagenome TaxID=1076179 RepID=A0A645G9M5_9ZZZZ
MKFVINGYDLVSHKNNTSGIVELISRTGIPVIGVVPYTQFAEKALSEGKPLTAVKNNPAGIALANISKRIAGLRVPLLDGIVKKRRRKSFY